MVFVRSCLDKKGFIEYEKNRVKDLQKFADDIPLVF